MTYLLTMPVDIIKIGNSFVDRLVPGDAAIFIVEGLMGIAQNLGIRVVAEGIETETQVDQLLKFGCTVGQEYLFSKAVDRHAATTIMQRSAQPLGGNTLHSKVS